MRRTLGIALVAVIALGLTACGSDSGGSMGDSSKTSSTNAAKVDIKTFRFRPTALRVNAGTTVTWTNRDDITHTVTSDETEPANEAFDSPVDGIGAKSSHKFATAGTYAYHSAAEHMPMTGKILAAGIAKQFPQKFGG